MVLGDSILCSQVQCSTRVFTKPPLISFRRCENPKEVFVRARLSNEGMEGIVIWVVFIVASLIVKFVKLCAIVTSFILRHLTGI